MGHPQKKFFGSQKNFFFMGASHGFIHFEQWRTLFCFIIYSHDAPYNILGCPKKNWLPKKIFCFSLGASRSLTDQWRSDRNHYQTLFVTGLHVQVKNKVEISWGCRSKHAWARTHTHTHTQPTLLAHKRFWTTFFSWRGWQQPHTHPIRLRRRPYRQYAWHWFFINRKVVLRDVHKGTRGSGPVLEIWLQCFFRDMHVFLQGQHAGEIYLMNPGILS